MSHPEDDKAVDQEPRLRTNIAAAQLCKVKLEIASLKWQNSWIGRLAQFATIITICATLVTIFATVFGLISERQKDRDLRTRELRERIATQYRSDIEQLLQYPTEDKQTITYVIFLLNDLEALIKTTSELKELSQTDLESGIKQQELAIADLLSNLTTSTKFDYNQPRNVEFDLRCLDHWEAYKTILREQKTQNNVDIIGKYAAALETLYKEDPVYVGTVDLISPYVFQPASESKFTQNYNKTIQFADLYFGFNEHVELLRERLRKSPGDEENVKNIELAHQVFSESTHNQCLTQKIFHDLIPESRTNSKPKKDCL